MIDFQARPRLAAIPALCIAVSLTFGTAGCSNIQDDGTRTKTEGTLVGGGIGAAFGALLGGLIGGDGKGALIGAGIGAENVTCQIEGLGRVAEIQAMYVAHTAAVM